MSLRLLSRPSVALAPASQLRQALHAVLPRQKGPAGTATRIKPSDSIHSRVTRIPSHRGPGMTAARDRLSIRNPNLSAVDIIEAIVRH